MRDDTKIINLGDNSTQYGLHNGLTVSVTWRGFYSKRNADGNAIRAEMACFDTHSDDEMEMVWRTREVWDGAGGSDVLMNVPQERVLELVTEAEKWRCPRCKKS